MKRAVWAISSEHLLERLVGKERASGVRLLGVQFDPFRGYVVELAVEDPECPHDALEGEIAPVTVRIHRND